MCVFTNCAEVSLYLNGKEQGTSKVARNRAEWTIPFEPGELVAQAEANGSLISSRVCTSGVPAGIILEDVTPQQAKDALIFNIELVDAHLVHVPDDDRLLHFTVEGGEVWGVGNGDPNGQQSDVASEITTFNGHCQLIVRAKEDNVTVTVESPGLPTQSCTVVF